MSDAAQSPGTPPLTVATERTSNDVTGFSGLETTDTSRSGEGGTRLAPAWLPCGVRQAAQVIVYDMLLESDSFTTISRKIMGVAALILGVMGIVVGTMRFATKDTSPRNTGFALSWYGLAPCISLYVYLRATQRAPTALMIMYYGYLALVLGVMNSTNVSFPYFGSTVLLLITAALMDLPRPHVWGLLMLPVFALSAYNDAAMRREQDHFDSPPLLFVTIAPPTRYEFIQRLVSRFIVTVVTYMVAWQISSMLAAFKREITRARRSALLAHVVARELGRYETERARCYVEAALDVNSDCGDTAAASAGVAAGGVGEGSGPDGSVHGGDDALAQVVEANIDADGLYRHLRGADPALTEALTKIIENLEQYRPHLPNWLLNAAQSQSAAGDPLDDSVSTVSTKDSASQRQPPTSARTRGSGSQGRRSANGSQAGSSRRGGSKAGRRNAVYPPLDVGTTATVSHARVHFVVDPMSVLTRPECAQVSHALVDGVSEAARGTGAAVHSFIGDCVDATWNAASATGQPAMKAARFFARLKVLGETLEEKFALPVNSTTFAPGVLRAGARAASSAALTSTLSGSGFGGSGRGAGKCPRSAHCRVERQTTDVVLMWGAGVTGGAKVHMAGRKLQRALLVREKWAALLLEIECAAAQLGALLVCDRTAQASFDVRTRAATAVALPMDWARPMLVSPAAAAMRLPLHFSPGCASAQATAVFEVGRELALDPGETDTAAWLYKVAGGRGSPVAAHEGCTDRLNAALRAASVGQYAEANAILRRTPSLANAEAYAAVTGHPEAPPCVIALIAAITASAADPTNEGDRGAALLRALATPPREPDAPTSPLTTSFNDTTALLLASPMSGGSGR